MLTHNSEYDVVYLATDGELVSGFKTDDFRFPFRRYPGGFYVPEAYYG